MYVSHTLVNPIALQYTDGIDTFFFKNFKMFAQVKKNLILWYTLIKYLRLTGKK